MTGTNRIHIHPTDTLRGQVAVPGDKSVSHRALLFSALAEGSSRIRNLAPGADVQSTASVLQALSVSILQEDGAVVVQGTGRAGFTSSNGPLDCGNSGTTMRLMMGMLAGTDFESVLIGDASLSSRPMARIADPLRQMGLEVELTPEGTAPIRLRGMRPRAIHWTSRVASAQVKSAILLAGLAAPGCTSVTEPTRSRDHTERLLRQMGVPLEVKGNKVALHGPTRLSSVPELLVPGDLSSAAFWLVAGLLRGEDLRVLNVGLNPTRTGVLDALEAMGATLEITRHVSSIEPMGDIVVRRQPVVGTTLEGDLVVRAIDEIPILAVLATQALGRTVIRDASELRVKECDRITATVSMLQAMGAHISELEDGMVIEGPTPLQGAFVYPMHDHRIAMSGAIAAICVDDGTSTTIHDADVARVSYPNFYADLNRLCA